MTTFQTVTTFARILRNWAEAIEASDIRKARFYSEQIRSVAMLIAVDPAYKTLFSEYGADFDFDDSEQAAKCIHAFITAATDAAINGRNHGRE